MRNKSLSQSTCDKKTCYFSQVFTSEQYKKN